MKKDHTTTAILKRYSAAFQEARDRAANESDTVMFLIKFFEEVLGWNAFKGEITKEVPVNDRRCDIALKSGGQIRFLVECKAVSLKSLSSKNIEQAENYAAHAGVHWVILTNGVEWQLFHLSFLDGEGIKHDLAFSINLIEELESCPEALVEKLSMLEHTELSFGSLEKYWTQKKALSAASVVRAMFCQDILNRIRKELGRHSEARLDIQDVFVAIREVLSREALLEAGDITITRSRKFRKKNGKAFQTPDVSSPEEKAIDVTSPTATPAQSP